jgi:hypothetical protein
LSDEGKAQFEEAAFGPPGSLTSMSFDIVPGTPPQEVNFGFTEESCHAAAAANTYGSLEAYLRYEAYRGVLATALQEADVQAVASPSFQSALGKWRDCIRNAGLDASDPIDLASQYSASPSNTAATSAAVADVACKANSDLLGEWNLALAAAAQPMEEQLAGVIEDFADLRSVVIAEALP